MLSQAWYEKQLVHAMAGEYMFMWSSGVPTFSLNYAQGKLTTIVVAM
jgi:hypothetical protein